MLSDDDSDNSDDENNEDNDIGSVAHRNKEKNLAEMLVNRKDNQDNESLGDKSQENNVAEMLVDRDDNHDNESFGDRSQENNVAEMLVDRDDNQDNEGFGHRSQENNLAEMLVDGEDNLADTTDNREETQAAQEMVIDEGDQTESVADQNAVHIGEDDVDENDAFEEEGDEEYVNQDHEENIQEEEEMNLFQWEVINGQFQPTNLPVFQRQGRNGILVDTNNFRVVDYFELFFKAELYELIAEQTNKYAQQKIRNNNLAAHSRYHAWSETDAAEIQAYIALEIAMSTCPKPSIKDYWGNFWLTRTPNFSHVMPRDRFELIRAFLHFNDNENQPAEGHPEFDPLYKIRKIFDVVDPALLAVFSPPQNLSLDESMLKFKGRFKYKQYNPKKPTKWGIKEFALADPATSYLFKRKTYIGRHTTIPEDGHLITEQVVLDLASDFEDNGHVIFMDSFYSSPRLYKELLQKGIGACGTINPRRKGMPTEDLRHLRLRKGDPPVFMEADSLLLCSWQDIKRVNLLSTVSQNTTVPKQVGRA